MTIHTKWPNTIENQDVKHLLKHASKITDSSRPLDFLCVKDELNFDFIESLDKLNNTVDDNESIGIVYDEILKMTTLETK